MQQEPLTYPNTLASPVHGGNSLKVVYRYGPCSPSGDGLPIAEQILGQDSQRVAYLQLQDRVRLASATGNRRTDALQASLQATLPLLSGATIGSGSYVVTIGLGSPATIQTVVFDTGSNVCWVQCQPCRSCYPQRQPIFNPATSSSYRNVTFNDPACTFLPPGTRSASGNICVYCVIYGDNSRTTGFLATDRLTLGQTGILVENFVFGCGHTNGGHFSGVAGMFGLGRAFHSLVSQTSSHLGNVFSYCLPTLPNGVGYLTFGRRAPPPLLYTPLRPDPHRIGMYYIDLLGISVARRRLSLSPMVFQSVGTIIDSGTVLSRLPPEAYKEFRTAFRNGMAMYRQAPPFQVLDTCYDITTLQFPFPDVTLHFNGADLSLKPQQVFYSPNTSLFCLAFTSAWSGALGVIGNTQQRGTEVIYDIGNGKIGFLPQAHC